MLTKSLILTGIRCPRKLWYQVKQPELAAPTPQQMATLAETGWKILRLARKRYGCGVLIDQAGCGHREAVEATRAALDNCRVPFIYEGAFAHDGVRVRADILQRRIDGRWDMIEVKSTGSVKSMHAWDVTVQQMTLEGAGVRLGGVYLLHLNTGYVYDGVQLDLSSLFLKADMTARAAQMRQSVAEGIRRLQDVLRALNPPAVEPSRHCTRPRACEFWKHCRRRKPVHWILELPRLSAQRALVLQSMGVVDIREIPTSFQLTQLQKRVRDCVLEQKEYVSPGLEKELQCVVYPVHFLDFEAFNSAVPRYPRTRPYQVLAFQWSDHMLHQSGRVEHHEYLSADDRDPREELARTLLQTLGRGGTVFTYGHYERQVVETLARDVPVFSSRLKALLPRLKDLRSVIERHYYNPEFHGSFSLKAIVAALLPQIDYRALSIQQGEMASLAYLRMTSGETAAGERETIRRDLLRYCAYDTLAMLWIREALLVRKPRA